MLTKERAVVVKKERIIENFFEEVLCIMTFFIPDSFLKNDVLTRQNNLNKEDSDLLVTLDVNEVSTAYSVPLIPYFYTETKLSEELLALKFKVLLLNILDNPANQKNK